MKPFRFRWQRILEFRTTKLAEEERKLASLREELARLERQRQHIEQDRAASTQRLAVAATARGEEFMTLTRYQAKLQRGKVILDEEMLVCEQRLAQQREVYLAARRQYRLIEKLRERRLAEWMRDSNRAVGKLADELFLARWERR